MKNSEASDKLVIEYHHGRDPQEHRQQHLRTGPVGERKVRLLAQNCRSELSGSHTEAGHFRHFAFPIVPPDPIYIPVEEGRQALEPENIRGRLPGSNSRVSRALL